MQEMRQIETNQWSSHWGPPNLDEPFESKLVCVPIMALVLDQKFNPTEVGQYTMRLLFLAVRIPRVPYYNISLIPLLPILPK